MNHEKERKALCDWAQRMWRAGLVIGSAGNISMRSAKNPDRYVITPSSLPYEHMTPKDLVVIDGKGESAEGERPPSIEAPMHLAVYGKRPDAGAVFHIHSTYATTLAVLHRPIPPVVDEMVVYIGGQVEVAPYAAPGSEELARHAVAALGERAAVLLANHGALCVGKDPTRAYKICELVERLAQVVFNASLLGKPIELPADVQEQEREMYQIVRTM